MIIEIYKSITSLSNTSPPHQSRHQLSHAFSRTLLWSFNTPQQSGNEAKTSSSRPKETPPRDPAYKDAVKAA